MLQLSLPLTEAAPPDIEALIEARTCPVHTGTTVEFGICEMCDLDEQQFRAQVEADRHVAAIPPAH